MTIKKTKDDKVEKAVKSTDKKTPTLKKATTKTAAKKTTTQSTVKKKLSLNEKLNQVIDSINHKDKKVILTDDNGNQTPYTPVKVRVLETRKVFGFDIKIITTLMNSNEAGTSALFRAEIEIKDDNNEWQLVSTGHSQENKSTSATNLINYLENAETSAVGRALSNLGIDGGSTSETELLKQFTNKGTKEFGGKTKDRTPKASAKQINKIKDIVDKDPHYTIENILKENGVKRIEDLTSKRADEIISLMDDDLI